MSRRGLRSTALVATLLCGCAKPPPPAAPVIEAPAPAAVDPGPSSVEGEIGGMNEEAVTKAFASLSDGVSACAERGRTRLSSLGGQLTIRLRIDRQGAARWAYLSASTLGDRETEKCVLDLARARTWPRPVGGEGNAETSFDIDPRTPPRPWSDRQVQQAMSTVQRATAACRRSVPGGFAATAYLRSDGRVAAAGVALPSEKGEGGVDCVVEALRRLRFGPQGARGAKASFVIR